MRKLWMQWVAILCVGIAVAHAGTAKRPRYEW